MAELLDPLITKVENIPDIVEEAYKEAVVEEVDNSAIKLNSYFIANSGSATLNAHRDVGREWRGSVYFAKVDWDNKTPVNELQGKSWGRFKDKPRKKGKRNFSINPATTHDLAYIINYGERNADGSIKRVGTYFINKGFRRIKDLDKNIERTFRIKLDDLNKTKS